MSSFAEDIKPGLKTEEEILNAGWEVVKAVRGAKAARYLFNYDEDFPSDLISDYRFLEQQRTVTQ